MKAPNGAFIYAILLHFSPNLLKKGEKCATMSVQKRINTVHLKPIASLSGAPFGVFGDKEIAVRICGNSHYRISHLGQVGMLIVLCLIKVSWASGRDAGFIFGYGYAIAPTEGAFILSFF